MTAIRTHLLTEGLGEDVAARPLLWKLLLGVPTDLNAKAYAALVAKGASPAYSKVVANHLPRAHGADPQRHLPHVGDGRVVQGSRRRGPSGPAARGFRLEKRRCAGMHLSRLTSQRPKLASSTSPVRGGDRTALMRQTCKA